MSAGALVWCLKKPERELREKVELWLAWQRVTREIAEGTLGADFDRTDRAEIRAAVRTAEDEAMELRQILTDLGLESRLKSSKHHHPHPKTAPESRRSNCGSRHARACLTVCMASPSLFMAIPDSDIRR
jgi:hypothetical protein